ncbi:MAG TPA: hypothetical protein VEQ59_16020 [Polyangiaceae bacterium]|nr:hypothetical protein [Polyangiaceae bacterium]
MSRPKRAIFGLALAIATAAPLLRDARHDSYPFSTYPMFARTLTKPRLTFAEGLTRSGPPVRLPPEMVANDEPMQAMRTLKLTANDGPEALKSLCSAIAARVADSPRYAEVRRVRIAQARFDPLTYFEADSPRDEQEALAECRVRRKR